jgi:mono/diheme cytochrome c family protein
MILRAAVMLSLAAASLSSCTKQPTDPNAPVEPPAARGKKVYMANCVACHNANPALDGPIGPSVAGSSRELLSKRIMEAAYPDGYKPKRATKLMAATPHLGGDIEALEAFLNGK